ncbi:MAG: hypothetical protein LLG02_06875 [Pelosinus sp.]|nr:hypothetical protein [Pelosinus sp.]
MRRYFMKINFTKQEYKNLLDILYIADWITSAFDETGDSKMAAYDQVTQKLLSHAKDFGFEDYVEHDKSNGRYYPSRQFEDETTAQGIIDEYDNDTFWDELAHRLAQRDMEVKYGREQLNKMSMAQVMEEMSIIEDAYNNEFEETGLLKVNLVGLQK